MRILLFSFIIFSVVNAQNSISSYEVFIEKLNPKVARVKANLTLNDGTIQMAPWGHPSLKHGWATFVKRLRIESKEGSHISFSIVKNDGWGKWEVDAKNGSSIILNYEVHFEHDQYDWDPAGGIDARPEIRDEAYFLISKSLFIYSNSTEEAKITFNLPQSWQIASSWNQISSNSFKTSSQMSLINNALVVGKFYKETVRSESMNLIMAIDLKLKNYASLFTGMLQKQLIEFSRIFNGTPAKNYLISIRTEDIDDGESFTDSFTQVIRHSRLQERQIIWANAMSHEMFHYWNGNNFIVGENPADLYWFTEGFTDYYSSLSLIRTGMISELNYLKKLENFVSRYVTAKKLWPEEQVSLIAAGSEKIKNWMFIYGGGALMALVLDIEIRSQTNNTRSLDDVMLLLKRRYGDSQIRITNDNIKAVINEVSGKDFSDFFTKFIEGTKGYLNYQYYLDKVGLYVDHFVDEIYISIRPNNRSMFDMLISNQITR